MLRDTMNGKVGPQGTHARHIAAEQVRQQASILHDAYYWLHAVAAMFTERIVLRQWARCEPILQHISRPLPEAVPSPRQQR